LILIDIYGNLGFKIIDFGGASSNHNKNIAYTKGYLDRSKFFKVLSNCSFENRIRAELFCVG